MAKESYEITYALNPKTQPGIRMAIQSLSNSGPNVSPDDLVDDLYDDLQRSNWDALWAATMRDYQNLDCIESEANLLASISHVEELVASVQNQGYGWREKKLPEARLELNQCLWPALIEAWGTDALLTRFDVRLSACALYVNLDFLDRMFALGSAEVDKASVFVLGNVEHGRLILHPIVFRLINILFSLNHRFGRFDIVAKLLDMTDELLTKIKGLSTSSRDYCSRI